MSIQISKQDTNAKLNKVNWAMAEYYIHPKCLSCSSIAKAGGIFYCTICEKDWTPIVSEHPECYKRAPKECHIILSHSDDNDFCVGELPSEIGRSSNFDPLINDITISKKHFKLFALNESLLIESLTESATVLNENKIKKNIPEIINPGDKIVVGENGTSVLLRIKFDITYKKPGYNNTESIPIHIPEENGIYSIGGVYSDIVLRECLDLEKFYLIVKDGSFFVVSSPTFDLFINHERILEAKLAHTDIVEFNKYKWEFDLVNKKLTPSKDSKTYAISVRDLRFTIEGTTILKGVSLDIASGSLTAIMGASGGGKSTTIKILSGIYCATNGSFELNGKICEPLSYQSAIKDKVSFVPQDDTLRDELDIVSTLRFQASLLLKKLKNNEQEAIILKVADDLELMPHLKKKIGILSGGQRKRVNVALELITDPSIIFLDEPTTGLDTATENALLACLKKIAMKGKTVVVVSHSVNALPFFDHLVVINAGKTEQEGPPEEIKYNDSSLVKVPDSKLNRLPNSYWHAIPSLPNVFILFGRYTSIWLSNPFASIFSLFFLPLLMGILMRIAVPTDSPDGKNRIILGVICIFWVGMNQTVREFVREKKLFLRESNNGIGVISYVFSKLIFFFIIGLIQTILMALPLIYLKVTKTPPFLEQILAKEQLDISPILIFILIHSVSC